MAILFVVALLFRRFDVMKCRVAGGGKRATSMAFLILLLSFICNVSHLILHGYNKYL